MGIAFLLRLCYNAVIPFRQQPGGYHGERQEHGRRTGGPRRGQHRQGQPAQGQLVGNRDPWRLIATLGTNRSARKGLLSAYAFASPLGGPFHLRILIFTKEVSFGIITSEFPFILIQNVYKMDEPDELRFKGMLTR
jgi:hypothetical protein